MSEEAVPVEAEAVQSHATNVVTWDVPSAIVAGERFRIKVGVKCTSECSLANGRFGIYDHEGTHVADGVLPGDVWPGTTGLYAADIELRAPAEQGLYTWSVRAPVADVGVPHEEGSSTFGVRVVNRPDHRVIVEAFDKDSYGPLAGARVVMHPYQAVTDERGVAELRVAKGTYRLFVSQTRYETFALPLEVTGDMATKAELSLEPVLERN
jgi:hypothetical protein